MRASRPVAAWALAALLAPLLFQAGPSQATGEPAHVVVLDASLEGDLLHLTVTTYTRPGLVQSAGLFVNGAMVSNGTGGVWLDYDRPSNLTLRLLEPAEEVELRITYDASRGNTENITSLAIPLRLHGGPDVRPVDAWEDGAGNVTVRLQNFGRGTARGFLVSLRDADGVQVGIPYFAPLADLAPGASATAAFRRLDRADGLVLGVESPAGLVKHALALRSAAPGGPRSVELTTDFPSLQAPPGTAALFHLKLANKAADQLVQLGTTGLPDGWTATYTIGGSRVQTVQLAAGATRDVELSVAVPASGDAAASELRFEAWAAQGQGEGAARLATAPLTVQVTGAARLELTGRNWFATLGEGATLDATITVRNTGTAAAHDVALRAAAPSGWQATFAPERIDRLGPGESRDVTLRLSPPGGTADGRYVIDVGAAAAGASARERSFTVEVAHPQGSLLPWFGAAGAAMAVAALLVVRFRRT